jgi:catechol 2,3-dioxygenase-like lactoylglutathione lyase family enzyme
MAIRTLGLSHLELAVRDPERSLRFYAKAFGVREYFRDANQVQVVGPGPNDVLAFARDAANAGKAGGIRHFGFRLESPEDIDAAVQAVLNAGGALLRRGEFGPRLPFAYVADPDGYEIELWFEPEARPDLPFQDATPTPAPASDRRRPAITAAVRAHRCLRRLPEYTVEPDPNAAFGDALGTRIGTYRNPDGSPVYVHMDGLRWQGGAQRLYVAYDDIAQVIAPDGENSQVLQVVPADGFPLTLPVRGAHGRFRDSMDMLRFLTRVREDRGRVVRDDA